MAKKKPIYMITFMGMCQGSITSMTQPIKANNEEEAIEKFKKHNPKVSIENDVIDIDFLEETHKHFLLLSKGAK